jgi:cytoskeletal protein RodZ
MYKLSMLEACPMKKLFGLLLSVLIIYVIYFDLTVGTLPTSAPQHVDAQVENTTKVNNNKPNTDIPAFEAKVKPGDTVISIVEKELDKSLPVSITELIEDFKKLNKGKSPEKIQSGSTYVFPDYSKK